MSTEQKRPELEQKASKVSHQHITKQAYDKNPPAKNTQIDPAETLIGVAGGGSEQSTAADDNQYRFEHESNTSMGDFCMGDMRVQEQAQRQKTVERSLQVTARLEEASRAEGVDIDRYFGMTTDPIMVAAGRKLVLNGLLTRSEQIKLNFISARAWQSTCSYCGGKRHRQNFCNLLELGL